MLHQHRHSRLRAESIETTSPPSGASEPRTGAHNGAPANGPHCLLCVFPLTDDIAAVPCAHDGLICATCAVKVTRHLGSPRCCPFCKTEWPDIIFVSATDLKPYDKLASSAGLLPIESISARSPSKFLVDKYNKLLTCHCVKCDENGVSIDFLTLEKLQAHLKRKHQLQFCMACAQHRKVFVAELELYSEAGYRKHMKEGIIRSDTHPGLDPHPKCRFCRVPYYSKDELFVHMEREHYHCHFCRKSQEPVKYERTYNELEAHFRRHHYLCDDANCLAARFVVFNTELALRGHRLQSHSGHLTQKERRALGNVQVDLMYRTPSVHQQPADPRPLSAVQIDDLQQFPPVLGTTRSTTSMGWGGFRPQQRFQDEDPFPSLQPNVQRASNPPSNDPYVHRSTNRMPLRQAKPSIDPCDDPQEAKVLNSKIMPKMKALADSPSSFNQFRDISKNYLHGQGMKAHDLFNAFVSTFGGLDGTTQEVLEDLISLLPDKQKRQALHLVYRHEADRMRTNTDSGSTPSSSSVQPQAAPQWVKKPILSHSASASALLERPRIVQAAPLRTVQAPATRVIHSRSGLGRATQTIRVSQEINDIPPLSSWAVSPLTPVIHHPVVPLSSGSPPPMESFPALDAISSSLPQPDTSSEYSWGKLLEPLYDLNPNTIELPPVVCQRLEFCLTFAKHCISILQERYECGAAVPVVIKTLRRAQTQARTINISDLDVRFPLNNLGVSVQHIMKLQSLFRSRIEIDYEAIRVQVQRILLEMTPGDLYVLVDYVMSMYKHIEKSRPKKMIVTNGQSRERQNRENGSGRQSKKNQQRSHKRTLIQFG